jgi:nitrite reductase/ring-hydroxylating ferredoxin subunit
MTAETPAPPTDATPVGQAPKPDPWWFVDLSEAVRPGTQARRMILGEPVLVGRTRAGAAFALRDICPHRAAPLSAGRIVSHEGEGETVECPYHGWRFRTDGVCAAIPSLVEGDATDPSRIRVRAYPIVESQGLIFIRAATDPHGGGVPDAAPPTFPGAEGRARRVEVRTVDSGVDAVRAHMGAGDPGRQDGGEAGAGAPGWLWEPGQGHARRGPVLTCLTPLEATRTQVTRIRWSGPGRSALVRLFVRRR